MRWKASRCSARIRRLFIDYYRQAQAHRSRPLHGNSPKDNNDRSASDETTEWEQNEYFDFF